MFGFECPRCQNRPFKVLRCNEALAKQRAFQQRSISVPPTGKCCEMLRNGVRKYLGGTNENNSGWLLPLVAARIFLVRESARRTHHDQQQALARFAGYAGDSGQG